MSKRPPFRIGLALPVGFFLTILLAAAVNAWGSEGDLMGILDEKGNFVPKASITASSSTVTVTKIKPEEQFDFVAIKFLFPDRDMPGAMKDFFIQWEKAPGKWGKLWKLDGHSGFNNTERLFNGSWKISRSFMILDRSQGSVFRDRPWDQLLEIAIDGKTLIKKKPQGPVRESPRVESSSSVEIDRGSSPTNEESEMPEAPAPSNPAPRQALVSASPSIDRSARKALEQKYLELSEKIVRLEQAFAASQRWFYWGPLVALTLSILFCSVALLLTFVRLARGQSSNIPLPSHPKRVNSPIEDRFRQTG